MTNLTLAVSPLTVIDAVLAELGFTLFDESVSRALYSNGDGVAVSVVRQPRSRVGCVRIESRDSFFVLDFSEREAAEIRDIVQRLL